MSDEKPQDAMTVDEPLPEVVMPSKGKVEEGRFTIGGRTFLVSRGMTAEQEFHVLDLVDRAGLSPLLSNPPKEEDVNFVQFGYIATLKAYRSGVMWDLLASMLVEEGKKWTKPEARQVAEFFSTREDDESKSQLREVLVQAILGFFISGIGFDGTSLNSSPVPVIPRPSRSSGVSHDESTGT